MNEIANNIGIMVKIRRMIYASIRVPPARLGAD